jgi:hypothetical protein
MTKRTLVKPTSFRAAHPIGNRAPMTQPVRYESRKLMSEAKLLPPNSVTGQFSIRSQRCAITITAARLYYARRKRIEPRPPTTILVIIVTPPEQRKPTWGECFTECTGSARDSLAGRGCGNVCSRCASAPGSLWCRACAVCLGAAFATVEGCALKCCQLVGCPADK